MTHQHATIADTVYFWFGSNDTSGSGDDGAAPLADVRLAGAAAGAIPVLSPVPFLLTHANYPPGAYEVAVAATIGNGFAAGNTYAVFCTLTVDAQNPTGFVGSFALAPIIANVTEISDDAVAADNLEAVLDGGGVAADVDLSARSLTITNDAGVGVAITGTTVGLDVNATNGVGLDIDGTTSGVTADGAGGPGIHAGGTTFGMEITANAGPGLSAVSTGGNGDGIIATANGAGLDFNAATTDGLQVDTVEISGDSVAADNLEAFLDGGGVAADVDLTARSLTITNDAGVGVALTGTTIGLDVNATAGIGLDIDGTTSGITTNGAAGPGVHAEGTTFGMELTASNGPGLSAISTGGNGDGIVATANGAGIDFDAETTNGLQVDIVEISGDAPAAANLETAYDGGAYNVGGSAIIAASVVGAVGSVAGAVASVAGNVGGNVVGDVQGNVDGSVASVTARVTANTDQIEGADATDQIRDSVLDDATRFSGGDIDAAITTRATPAEVNAEVVDALATDVYAEPPQGAPGATISIEEKISFLYKFARNQITQTVAQTSVYNDAGAVIDQKATVADAAGTFTRGEFVSGP